MTRNIDIIQLRTCLGWICRILHNDDSERRAIREPRMIQVYSQFSNWNFSDSISLSTDSTAL